jgi:hypothetical protein
LPLAVASFFFLLARANFFLPDGVDFSLFIVLVGAYTSPVSEDFLPDGVVHFCLVHLFKDFCGFLSGFPFFKWHYFLFLVFFLAVSDNSLK